MRPCLACARLASLLVAGAVLIVAALPVPGLEAGRPPIEAFAGDPELVHTAHTVVSPAGVAADLFGMGIAVFGDTAVVGAPGSVTDAGAAWVFVRSGATWVQQAKLVASDGAAGDRFGWTAAIYGDTVLIGAQYEDSVDDNAGAAYVFVRSGATWVQQAKLTASDGAAGDHFGDAVAIDGDTVLIGAPLHDEKGSNAGAAYVFTRTGATWTQRVKLTPHDGAAEDLFGDSVALQGDTALVGSPLRDGAQLNTGAAYVFERSGSMWSEQGMLEDAAGAGGDTLGSQVALSGDTALVGARGENAQRGAAYVYVRTGATWSPQARLAADDGVAGDWFGARVALSGDVAVVSAPESSAASDKSGSAYVFSRSGTAWTQRAKLAPADGGSSRWYGTGLAVSGGTAIIGAPYDYAGPDIGRVFFHDLRPAEPAGLFRVAGSDRYATAVAASRTGFFYGAPTVVLATGANWPDALGGSALAGVSDGPLLLTRPASLPDEVRGEIARLGASRVYVLGGTSAISPAVEDELVEIMGRANVVRLAGTSRYDTARLIADETIRRRGPSYAGIIFVATGGSFPDATAAAPLAARVGTPIVLANPGTGALYVPPQAKSAIILGGTAAVSSEVDAALRSGLGDTRVVRLDGADRYETAAAIAQAGVVAGMSWNGVGLATGTAFPDALAGGPMLGAFNSVMLLTRSTALSSPARMKLEGNAASIHALGILGGATAISDEVESDARAAAGL